MVKRDAHKALLLLMMMPSKLLAHRLSVPRMMVPSEPVSAASKLLAEFAKPERSLDVVEGLIASLEADPPVTKASKQRRELTADWKFAFASDGAAVEPFTTGSADGPFNVLEDCYFRLRGEDNVQSIEVVRRIGPFGNTAFSLHGKWRVDSSSITWRPKYFIDGRGREVAVPSQAAQGREAKVTHVSDVLVLRMGQSFSVFERLGKGKLKKELDDFALDPELVLGR